MARIFFLVIFILFIKAKVPAQIHLVADGFLFTEGPAIDSRGTLYFSDVRDQKIYKLDQDGKPVVFLDNTGGANGLYFDESGDQVA